MQLTPMTELDAVNEILSAINESPISSLEDMNDIDAINAQKMLTNVNRQFQSRGWSFNHFESYVFNPDAYYNKIYWIDTILFIKGEHKLIKRGKFMYDLTDNTFFFKQPISAEVIMLTDFEDMPEAAKEYIVAKASTEFAMRYLGDPALLQGLKLREQEAWSYFNEYEHTDNDYNMLDNTYIAGIKQR
jgi:hypothetical protein